MEIVMIPFISSNYVNQINCTRYNGLNRDIVLSSKALSDPIILSLFKEDWTKILKTRRKYLSEEINQKSIYIWNWWMILAIKYLIFGQQLWKKISKTFISDVGMFSGD